MPLMTEDRSLTANFVEPADPVSCKAVRTANPGLGSGVYRIDPDGAGGSDPFDAYCDMTSDGGGWTLVLKADGASPAFAYDATTWTSGALLNAPSITPVPIPALLAGYGSVVASDVRVVLNAGSGPRGTVLMHPGGSQTLQALVTQTFAGAFAGSPAWNQLENVSLTAAHSVQGFNVAGQAPFAAVRIGMLLDDSADGLTPDYWIGVGARPIGGGSITGGGFVSAGTQLPSFAYVYVR